MKADRRRLEIVHESLLTRWPRLARWRAQDEEGAVLRDQLRQAAQSWEKHERADDFLWTGTAFREYQLWRERYPGGLTALEEAFARAMTRLVQRRRRRRQVAVVTVIVALATGVAVFAILRQRAVGEARRAEASKLLALGEVELQKTPTVALAHAIKSLELDDSPAARVFAVRALSAGPPVVIHPVVIVQHGPVNRVTFSPDGAWAVVIGASEKLHVVSRNGGDPRDLGSFPSGTGGVAAQFDAESKHLYAAKDGQVRIWSVPDFRLVETQQVGGTFTSLRRRALGMLAITRVRAKPSEMAVTLVAAGEAPRPIGRFFGFANWDVGPEGTSVALAEENGVFVRSLTDAGGRPRRVATQDVSAGLLFHPAGDRLAGYDKASRTIRMWSTAAPANTPLRELHTTLDPLHHYAFDHDGRHLAAIGTTPDGLRVESWDLEAPLDEAARTFPATFGGFLTSASFSPDGRWLVTANFHAACFWPLARSSHRVLAGHRAGVTGVRFTPDGKRIISRDRGGEVREWALDAGGNGRTLAHLSHWGGLSVDPRGRFVAVAQPGGVGIIPLGGGETRALGGFARTTHVMAVAIDRDGRRVAAAAYWGPRHEKVIRVWELESGKVWTLGPTEKAGEGGAGQNLGLGFLADGSLVSAGDGLRRWSIEKGTHELVAPSHVQTHLRVFPDGHSVAYKVAGERGTSGDEKGPLESVWLAITDFQAGRTNVIRSHGRRHLPLAVDPTGALVVTGGLDGIVRVGPVTGGEPHLLLGHEGWIHGVDVSPDGRWVAAGGDDRKIHIWPMPDMTKPPLHTLPREVLLTKLRSLTNLRVVEESKSRISAWLRTDRGTGYELDLEPFPGWAKAPEP
jgi:WD40 repeat protein